MWLFSLHPFAWRRIKWCMISIKYNKIIFKHIVKIYYYVYKLQHRKKINICIPVFEKCDAMKEWRDSAEIFRKFEVYSTLSKWFKFESYHACMSWAVFSIALWMSKVLNRGLYGAKLYNISTVDNNLQLSPSTKC